MLSINKTNKVIFSPEILDNQKHCTIIYIRHELLFHSMNRQEELTFLKLLQEGTVKEDIDTQLMGFTETVKQFERHILPLSIELIIMR